MQLVPEPNCLKFLYVPLCDGVEQLNGLGAVELQIPVDAIGGLWATARAFLYGVESLDENVILRGSDGDILIKLYRDKPKGQNGRLSGEEVCWLRIVTGRTEEERRRIKLGPRDLLCIELACNAVLVYSSVGQKMPLAPVTNTSVAGVKPDGEERIL